MLQEYVLVPDVFDTTCYPSHQVADHCLSDLKEPLLNEALVRDLRMGEWRDYVRSAVVNLHPRGRELLKKLERRLRRSVPALAGTPTAHADWCNEALASHASDRLSGIITTVSVATSHLGNPMVGDIMNLSSVPWWKARSPSVRLERTTADYLRHLRLILAHSNSLMFIDRMLMNPENDHYRKFGEILRAAGPREPSPRIELHRVCYVGKKENRYPNEDWERTFRHHLSAVVKALSLRAEVFIWDDFHDRYLISDLVGLLIPNGFDIASKVEMTTWSRLGLLDRDDVQREFDPASQPLADARKRHQLLHRFELHA